MEARMQSKEYSFRVKHMRKICVKYPFSGPTLKWLWFDMNNTIHQAFVKRAASAPEQNMQQEWALAVVRLLLKYQSNLVSR